MHALRSSTGRRRRRATRNRLLNLEMLELRNMLSVTLGTLRDIDVPIGKTVLVPLTAIDSEGGSITYQLNSSDDDVLVSLASPGSMSLKLDVSGIDGDDNAFSGTLILKLFEDLAPGTTARIKQLVNTNFYNGLLFHRVADGFVAQAGQNSGTTITDEFHPSLTFTSPGLLAMANRGRDTSDAQFFITATTEAGSNDPIELAQMPQSLNFRYTIFGQLVSGFDIFEKLMSTDVVANPNIPGEVSRPVNDVTITSAELITDAQNGVLRVASTDGFSGDVTITVTARNALGETSVQMFTASAAADTRMDPPFLGPVTNQSTTAGTPVTFTLTSTDASEGGVLYAIAGGVDANDMLTTPSNVTVNINQSTGQVTLTPAAGFTGTINLLAAVRAPTASNLASNHDTQAFTLTVTSDSSAAPTLGAVSDQTTTQDTPVTFTLTSTDPPGRGVVYVVVDPTTFQQPANVTVTINQNTGAVTLTPATGFTGTIDLVAGVRASFYDDVPDSYDTKPFKLTVTNTGVPAAPTGLAIDSSSLDGPFDGNGYLSTPGATLVVTAATGSTVRFMRNGTVVATGTETAAGSGQYRATLPAGALAVGSNAITATASNANGDSAASSELAITYAPDYGSGVYVVPGQPGAAQSLTFAWTSKNAAYNNEFGYIVVDTTDGAIDGVAPGAPGYAQAALESSTRGVIFASGQSAGANATVAFQGGQFIVFYMVQNNTTGNFLARNPSNAAHGNSNGDAPLAFFSVTAANPDGQRHAQIIADPMTGHAQYNWEDLFNLGDGDFNDAAITARVAGQATASPAGLRVPGSNRDVTLAALLQAGNRLAPLGDVGVFFVDNPNGTIGGTNPGDSAYAALALASANSRVLFSAGQGGSRQVTVPAGRYLGFYAITSGTTANFLATNSANANNGGPVALFSFDSANPDDLNHFRWYTPNQQAANPDASQLHIMDSLFGGEEDFDAFAVDLRFTN